VEIHIVSSQRELNHVGRSLSTAMNETRQQIIEAIMKQLRPKIEQTARQMVERAGDVPEAGEFGAIDFAFRDAEQKLANEARQAGVASRQKGLPLLGLALKLILARYPFTVRR
jgi:hypothetical protein